MCVRPFAAWRHPTTNRLILEQVCSWPVRRQCLQKRRNSCFKREIVLYIESIFLYRRDRFLQEENIWLQDKIFCCKKKILFLERDMLIEYYLFRKPSCEAIDIHDIFFIFVIISKPLFKLIFSSVVICSIYNIWHYMCVGTQMKPISTALVGDCSIMKVICYIFIILCLIFHNIQA